MNSSNARVPLFFTPMIRTSGKWRRSSPCCCSKRYLVSLSFHIISVSGTIRTIEPRILISVSLRFVSFNANDSDWGCRCYKIKLLFIQRFIDEIWQTRIPDERFDWVLIGDKRWMCTKSTKWTHTTILRWQLCDDWTPHNTELSFSVTFHSRFLFTCHRKNEIHSSCSVCCSSYTTAADEKLHLTHCTRCNQNVKWKFFNIPTQWQSTAASVSWDVWQNGKVKIRTKIVRCCWSECVGIHNYISLSLLLYIYLYRQLHYTHLYIDAVALRTVSTTRQHPVRFEKEQKKLSSEALIGEIMFQEYHFPHWINIYINSTKVWRGFWQRIISIFNSRLNVICVEY